RHWGQGIMTAVVAGFAPWVMDELGLYRLAAQVMAGNPASAGALLKTGFTEEGLERQAGLQDGRLHDLRRFARLQAWPAHGRGAGADPARLPATPQAGGALAASAGRAGDAARAHNRRLYPLTSLLFPAWKAGDTPSAYRCGIMEESAACLLSLQLPGSPRGIHRRIRKWHHLEQCADLHVPGRGP